MTITSQAGVLGFAPQANGAKGGTVTNWYRHRSGDIDLAILDDVRVGPPEIGGDPTPTIPYKAGAIVGGGATIFPRLEDTLGWLLLGVMGSASVETDRDIDGAVLTGSNHHTFKFASIKSFVPYYSFRKLIPADTAADELAEVYSDCKIIGLTLNFPNDGLISARIDTEGRLFTLIENPGWDDTDWANTMEDYQSIPIGCVTGGSIAFGGTSLPVVAASCTMVNQPLDPRMEKIYGSPYISDVTIVGRSMTFDITVRYENPNLYQQALTGVANGTIWSAKPMVGSVVINAQTPDNMPTLTQPYKIRITAQSVLLQQVGGIRMASNNAVLMRFVGTALAPSSGDYAKIDIQNMARPTGYILPT